MLLVSGACEFCTLECFDITPFPGSVLVYVASSSALGFGKDSVYIKLLLFFMTMPTPKVNEEKLVLKLRSLRTFF